MIYGLFTVTMFFNFLNLILVLTFSLISLRNREAIALSMSAGLFSLRGLFIVSVLPFSKGVGRVFASFVADFCLVFFANLFLTLAAFEILKNLSFVYRHKKSYNSARRYLFAFVGLSIGWVISCLLRADGSVRVPIHLRENRAFLHLAGLPLLEQSLHPPLRDVYVSNQHNRVANFLKGRRDASRFRFDGPAFVLFLSDFELSGSRPHGEGPALENSYHF